MIRRLHPGIQITRTLTGRFAIAGYPLLGLPKHSDEGKRIRSLVKAPGGFVICELDYSQIELRVATELSQDLEMIRTFQAGEDIHVNTAAAIFGVPRDKAQQDPSKHRLPAKSGNFGFWMGLGEKGLTEQVHRFGNLEWSKDCPGCKSFRHPHSKSCDSCRFFDTYRALYPGAVRFQQARREHATRTGTAYGLWGMEWSLPGVYSPHEEIREQTLRQSFALPIQEGAQRLIKQAMAHVERYDLPWAQQHAACVEPLLQIHDSLLFCVERGFAEDWCCRVKRTMEAVATWSIPIVADAAVGPTWADLQAISGTTAPPKGKPAQNGTIVRSKGRPVRSGTIGATERDGCRSTAPVRS